MRRSTEYSLMVSATATGPGDSPSLSLSRSTTCNINSCVCVREGGCVSVGVAVAVLKAHLTSNGWPPSCLEASPLFDISAAVCRARSAFLGNVCVCLCVQCAV